MELASLDGVIAPAEETAVPVTDEGFLRGDGIFEVVRVYDGRPFALGEHLDRFERSAHNLRLGREVPREAIEADSERLLAERGGPAFDGLLRIVLTRGGRCVLITEPVPPAAAHIRLGFVTYAPPRILDGIKSLSYGANMLAGRLARERGFDEALLVTPHGRVLEAPTASLFVVDSGGELCTPPLEDHILASITRRLVMEVADACERPLTADELRSGTREAFIASTTREVQPVSAIEELALPAPGERTREVAEAVRARIAEALSSRAA